MTAELNLTDHFQKFVEDRITSGRYQDANEVLCAGLRLLEDRERLQAMKLERLRKEMKVGFDQLDRGEGVKLERSEIATHVANIADKVKKNAAQPTA